MKRNIVIGFILSLAVISVVGCSNKTEDVVNTEIVEIEKPVEVENIVSEKVSEIESEHGVEVIDTVVVEENGETKVYVKTKEPVVISYDSSTEISDSEQETEEIIEEEVVENNQSWGTYTNPYIRVVDSSETALHDSYYFTVVNDNVSDACVNEVIEYINMIPEDLIGCLSHYTLTVTNSYDGTGLSNGISGITRNKSMEIYIRATPSSFKYTVIHEIAHALDYNCGAGSYLSNNPEFQAIYQSEKDNYKSTVHIVNDGHGVSTSKEYFADAFQEYIINPNELAKNTPQTYEFLMTYFPIYD